MQLSVHMERWPAIRPFRISNKVWNTFDSIVVEVSRAGLTGRGEGLGVFYHGETVESLVAQIEQVADRVTAGVDRAELQSLLPAGGARNALDCALWDLEAKSNGRTIWQLLDIEPKPLETVFTIGLESTPEEMAAKAAAASDHRLLKIKLNDEGPVERLQAIRAARPDARLVVDVNEGWTFPQLEAVAPLLSELGVELIEQPLPRTEDGALEGYLTPVPLCADESCVDMADLETAAQRYQYINIKLDKTGGLTRALELARAARARDLGLMVGCMAGSSLAMAPAFVLGCLCDLVDIDGPLLQKSDRLPGLSFAGGRVAVFGRELWG